MIKSRSSAQIRSHAQKYFAKLSKGDANKYGADDYQSIEELGRLVSFSPPLPAARDRCFFPFSFPTASPSFFLPPKKM